MDSESESHQSSKRSNINIPIRIPTIKRRMSFDRKPATFDQPLDMTEDIDMGFLKDPNSVKFGRNAQRLPNFSKANDDIELERRKKVAKHKRLMGFLYAGDLPENDSPERCDSSFQGIYFILLITL
jgi:hypothetical protein